MLRSRLCPEKVHISLSGVTVGHFLSQPHNHIILTGLEVCSSIFCSTRNGERTMKRPHLQFQGSSCWEFLEDLHQMLTPKEQ
ncbi:unnamed protein product [Caretta caretta]